MLLKETGRHANVVSSFCMCKPNSIDATQHHFNRPRSGHLYFFALHYYLLLQKAKCAGLVKSEEVISRNPERFRIWDFWQWGTKKMDLRF